MIEKAPKAEQKIVFDVFIFFPFLPAAKPTGHRTVRVGGGGGGGGGGTT